MNFLGGQCHFQWVGRVYSNNQMHVPIMKFTLLENPQDGPRFVCMTLRGKMLQPGMSILSMLLLTSASLASLFDFAS